jgi:hypothetical protein
MWMAVNVSCTICCNAVLLTAPTKRFGTEMVTYVCLLLELFKIKFLSNGLNFGNSAHKGLK